MAHASVEYRDISPLLSWHTRISDFICPEPVWDELELWASNDSAISIKFITGDGGMGKSRLAAEFATEMKKRNWAAGFVDLRKAQTFPLEKAGTLLIVDYPEENRDGVIEFLKDLASCDEKCRVRVLFLSRQTVNDWREVISISNTGDLLDGKPVAIGSLDGPSAYKLYSSTLKRLSTELDTNPSYISEEELSKWLESAPENKRALFIHCAAVNSALNPDVKVTAYTVREIIDALVERETARLLKIERGKDIGEYAFARLLSMSAISKSIPIERVEALAGDKRLKLGFPDAVDADAVLQNSGLLFNRAINAPTPDIVASAFVVNSLKQKPETAGELLWAAIEPDVKGGLERISRLSYDAETVLGILDHRISRWLASGIDGKPDRCAMLDKYFSATNVMPLSWIEASIAACLSLLKQVTDDVEKARL